MFLTERLLSERKSGKVSTYCLFKSCFSKACLQPTVSLLIYFLIGDRVPYQVERMAHVIMYLGACNSMDFGCGAVGKAASDCVGGPTGKSKEGFVTTTLGVVISLVFLM